MRKYLMNNSKNLNNHVCFLKVVEHHIYYFTQINGVNYNFFIDKKIKEGYDYPKIFILPYEFSPELYKSAFLNVN